MSSRSKISSKVIIYVNQALINKFINIITLDVKQFIIKTLDVIIFTKETVT